MNVLLIGSGAREHAIAWKLRQSPKLTDLFVAPGNAGIARIAETLPLAIPKPYAAAEEATAFAAEVVRLARERNVELVVVAPDDPLALGLVDHVEAAGIAAFGPTKAAARIESSKAFAKDLMRRHNIPMGETATFSDFDAAVRYVESRPGDVVVKADGLAAGKGAIVTNSHAEALDALRALMRDGALGASGRTVVVEDKLVGRETSAHAFTDGKTVVHMPFACDHKPIFDGNRGSNTGGMGAYTPASWIDGALTSDIHRSVTESAIHALAAERSPFRGVIFPGLMITADGPRVIEYNARFGDPEAEVHLPRLDTDLLDIMLACRNGALDRIDVRWRDDVAVTVMLASGGYPDAYETGKPIRGVDDVDPGVIVFHAGTKIDERGDLVTNGGRVLAVTALARTIAQARDIVYRNIPRISFDGMQYRSDIGASETAVAV